MSTTVVKAAKIETVAELQHSLGDIPLSRILIRPYPGTEEDILRLRAKTGRLYELIDGVLVEKGMGFRESFLAIVLAGHLRDFVVPRKLGILTGESGMMRILTGLVRIPDVAFISWARMPDGIPQAPVPKLAPNLAVEVLSASNTPAEMKRKRREYFKAGVELMWIVDPDERTVTVYTSFRKFKTLAETDTLDGGDVLPGFTLSLKELFANLDQKAPE